jgi:hypothetical protein
MGDEYRNVAKGSASVGAQISRVHGDVTVSATGDTGQEIDTTALSAELHELRRLLEAAARDGLVDVHLLPAAVSSLDAADQAASSDGKVERGRLLRALETLQASVQGVAGISEAVASIISSLGGIR